MEFLLGLRMINSPAGGAMGHDLLMSCRMRVSSRGIQYVAAAKSDQPYDCGKPQGDHGNDRLAFTEVVKKIECGEQRDQPGNECGRVIQTLTPVCHLFTVSDQAIRACFKSSYSIEISWPV